MDLMNLIPLLIGFPFVVALLLAIIGNDKVRGVITYVGVIVTIVFAALVALNFWQNGRTDIWMFGPEGTYALSESTLHLISQAMMVVEAFLVCLIVYQCFKWKKYVICLLSIVQTALVFWMELNGKVGEEAANIRIDYLAVLMVLIVAVIGGLICVYAVGYMRGYHVHHSEYTDRRKFFFALLFVFLGAMFGLVLSANMFWLCFFWEITSLCSFLLIGYTRTDEAITNAFRALWMNLLGGLGMSIGIWYSVDQLNSANLDTLVKAATDGWAAEPALLIPVALLAFAALTKSAQMPFSKWLLGAMVAPTPTSALLHSATMVKAGVYLLIRLAPALAGNAAGTMVAFIGGFTFLTTSMLAISQNDGKRVLAYSTISNLGLITACAGIGTSATVWAAVFLVIFHAVSKSMLFQSVGAVENSTHSRLIEDMQGLIKRLPFLGWVMFTGIAGMYLAPFGMLISKWAALTAFIGGENKIVAVMMVIFLAFGSATTVFYWTKWMAKLIAVKNDAPDKDVTEGNEYASLAIHLVLMIGICALFPIVSSEYVVPLLAGMFATGVATISQNNLILTVVLLACIFVIPFLVYLFAGKSKGKTVVAYMAGVNTGDNKHFVNSFGESAELNMSNWYMENLFGEGKLLLPSICIAAFAVIVMLCWIIVTGGVL